MTHVRLREGTVEQLEALAPAIRRKFGAWHQGSGSGSMPVREEREAEGARSKSRVRVTKKEGRPEPRAEPEDGKKPVAEPVARAKPPLNPPGGSKRERLDWLREKAKAWPPAEALDSLRETMVFAVGNPDAELMLVGEAPGAEEEREGEPFVGPAGQKLDQILKAMGFTRTDVYISNIVKFRPAMANQGSGNRQPSEREMAACVDFVLAEIDVVEPKVIVALGGTAAQGLLELTDPVGQLRRGMREVKGVPVKVTYHPSYLLRNPALSEKRKVWEDMLEVMERLGMPISEKQRGYFTK